MSKATVQRKSTLKKPSIVDNETNRRRPCYQFIQEKQRKILAENDTRRINNQLDILREILFYQRNIHEEKSNKPIPKSNTTQNGKNLFIKTKNLNTSDEIEDNLSINSASEEEVEFKPVRLSRSNIKSDQQHPKIRSTSLYSQSMNNVSFMSDISKNGRKSSKNRSSGQLKKLLDHLWFELSDLESMTGYKPNKNNLSSSTSTAALATALITLTGHVKQCTPNSNEKDQINNLKDQLSIMIKNQLDFQQKIENQMTTFQTMLQTVCQLVNNEIIPNKKSSTPHIQRDESRQDWLSNAQKPYLLPKDTYNAMDELLMFTRRMNNGEIMFENIRMLDVRDILATPIDANHTSNGLHLAYSEILEASNKLTRPTSTVSTNEMNGNGTSERKVDQESHSLLVSPLFNMFELRCPNDNSMINAPRNGIGGTSTVDESILEKIFQERRRLVQQMAQLNKQHETTQEELANLEAKTTQSSST